MTRQHHSPKILYLNHTAKVSVQIAKAKDTKSGGEEAGMREAVVFYDIASEVERTKDAGLWPNFFMEFLADVDSNVTPDRDNDNPSLCKLRYRGREAKVIFNNNDTYNTHLEDSDVPDAEPAQVISSLSQTNARKHFVFTRAYSVVLLTSG